MMKPSGDEAIAQRCAISGEAFPAHDLYMVDQLRPEIQERIRTDFPGMAPDSRISRRELARYRSLYVQDLLRQERGELTALDEQVARSLAEGAVISANVEQDFDERRSLGERLSDALAKFGGSWSFLICFACLLAAWITINVMGRGSLFDPYPFILLNLILSCIAAIQAPVIMMSQKRQEAKDRLRSLNDYQVNLKAELEIRHLHEKLDHLISKQWQRLAEIQELQLEILQDQDRR
ncbi:DUF1003 domain-containing protein [Chelatococcus asaccharovorans]|uniref:DUF1003 domain-containing protein n=1 Tax=Chelatococcus asaccharovorans TaxID=28210 RepID=UPI00224C739F|nr:DUF1003 domain-containing protein [Chelatococcus asaccharovorans]CAH1668534.1 putative membrane protein [Chelatococcus asaccharovorans]CAH1680005.1 putative membrane protein [Chelatococcus asaccharovorans]